jgi:hypothetical protein
MSIQQPIRTVLLSEGIHPFTQRVANLFFKDWNRKFADQQEIPSPLLSAGDYFQLPKHDDAAFIHVALKLCLDLHANYFMPLNREEAMILVGAKTLFEEYGIQILAPDLQHFSDQEVMIQPTRDQSLLLFKEGALLQDQSSENQSSENKSSENKSFEDASTQDASYSGVFIKNDAGAYLPCFAR